MKLNKGIFAGQRRNDAACNARQRAMNRFRCRIGEDRASAAWAMKRSLAALSFAVAGLVSSTAFAATTTTTFSVSASVNKTCAVSAAPLAFGAYTPGGGAISATTSITVNCTKSTGFNVGLDAGATTGGTTTTRLMTDGAGDTLQYTLSQDSSHSTNWGNTVGTDTLAGTGAGMGVGNAIAETVYGQIPDNSTNQAAVPAASYTDTVTVTVTY